MTDTTPFLYRPHRGSLNESMSEVREYKTKGDLVEEAQRCYQTWLPADAINTDRVKVEPYGQDDRIGWDTHIVIVEGVGPIGFTDRMVN